MDVRWIVEGKEGGRVTRTNGRESISHLVGVSLSFARAQERESDYVHRPLFLPSATIQIPSYLDNSRSRKKCQRGKKRKDRKVGPYNAYTKKAKKIIDLCSPPRSCARDAHRQTWLAKK